MARKGSIVLVALSVLASPATTRAAPGDGSDVATRYAFIDGELARGDSYARGWWTVWTVGYSASIVGGATLAALTTNYDLRVDATVDSIKSALAVGSLMLTMRDPFTSRSELAAMDFSTPEARTMRLARAEELLKKSADDEALASGWLARIAAFGVNLAGGAVLWFGYGQRALALIDVATGVVIGEIQVLTTPTDAIDSYRRYRAGDFTPRAERRASWSITPMPGGAGVRLAF